MNELRIVHPSVKARVKGRISFHDVYDEVSPLDALSKVVDPLINPLYIPTVPEIVSGLQKIADIADIDFDSLQPLIDSQFVESIPSRPTVSSIRAKVSPFFYLYQWGGIELINSLDVENRSPDAHNIFVAKLSSDESEQLLISDWRKDKPIDVSDIFLSFITGNKVWSWLDIPLKSWVAVIQHDRTLATSLEFNNHPIDTLTSDERADMANILFSIYSTLVTIPKLQRWAWTLLLFKTCYSGNTEELVQAERDILFILRWSEFAQRHSFQEASRFLSLGKIDAYVAEQIISSGMDFELAKEVLSDY